MKNKHYEELTLVSDGTPVLPHFSIMLGDEKIGSACFPSDWKDEADRAIFEYWMEKYSKSERKGSLGRMHYEMKIKHVMARALARRGSAYHVDDCGRGVDKTWNHGKGRRGFMDVYFSMEAVYISDAMNAWDRKHVREWIECLGLKEKGWKIYECKNNIYPPQKGWLHSNRKEFV